MLEVLPSAHKIHNVMEREPVLDLDGVKELVDVY